jgi:hypothetical protein
VDTSEITVYFVNLNIVEFSGVIVKTRSLNGIILSCTVPITALSEFNFFLLQHSMAFEYDLDFDNDFIYEIRPL